MEVIPVGLRDKDEIERDLTAFAAQANGGIVVTTSALAQIHRDQIIPRGRTSAASMYPYRLFVTAGGLMAYGPDVLGQYRHAASYVHRILKGEQPDPEIHALYSSGDRRE